MSARIETPQAAEAAFYDAFEHADIDAMMRIWAEGAEIVCIHPGGPRLSDRRQIRRSWERIFASGTGMRFVLENTHCIEDSALSVHILRECIHVDGVLQGVMLATNAYQNIDGAWYMTLHHASPEPQGSRASRSKPEAVH